MQVSSEMRQAEISTSPPLSALAMFLMVSAGVGIIAQEAERARTFDPAAPLRTATIRIALPPPAPLAPARRNGSTGTLRILLRDVGSVASPALPAVPRPVVPKPASLAASSVNVPLFAPGQTAMDPTPSYGEPEVAAELAQVPGAASAGFAATMQEISANFSAASGGRASGKQRVGAVRADRLAEIAGESGASTVSASGPSLVASRTADPDPSGSSARAQMLLTEAMTPRKRKVASVSLTVSTLVNGTAAGRVSLLFNDTENISAQLADLLAVLKPALDPELYERLVGSQAAQTYMTFNELREAGIKVRFDADDRLLLTTP